MQLNLSRARLTLCSKLMHALLFANNLALTATLVHVRQLPVQIYSQGNKVDLKPAPPTLKRWSASCSKHQIKKTASCLERGRLLANSAWRAENAAV
eukprot:2633060-Amphidinium_carterae.1